MKLNTKPEPIYTHEGAKASHISAEQQLRRSVMACMLWEDQFYEDGKSIADRIRELVPKVKPEAVQQIAIKARTEMKLRHVPLLLVYAMTESQAHKGLVADTLATVIQRADELTEYCAIYFALGGKTLSAQSKKGLARAISKFNEYELAKYNRDGKFKLRDVLFLCHSKPKDAGAEKYTKEGRKAGQKRILSQGEVLYGKLTDNALQTPDTWEVALSGGADKKETFLRLMNEGKLGALAFLRNLRNMAESGVEKSAVVDYAAKVKTDRVLPFRFIAAARAVPKWENVVEPLMLRCVDAQEKITGKTVLLVDTSPSMDWALSKKSDLVRKDAALGVAILLSSICQDIEIVAFSSENKAVPPRKGFALADAIKYAVPSNGTLLGKAIKSVSGRYERLIVLTDEESQDAIVSPDKGAKAYMVNLASYENGVGYGQYVHINGWSESIIDYIRAHESAD